MTTKSNPKSPLADSLSQTRVVLSMPCARCGYELRELLADGDCPECGEPIRLTIIEVVDPTSRRLQPINNPKVVGNAILGVVFFFFLAAITAVIAILSHAPSSLPIPEFVQDFNTRGLVWFSVCSSVAAIVCLFPIAKMCQQSVLEGCRKGIMLSFFGMWLWTISMVVVSLVLLRGDPKSSAVTMLFDTCLPVISAGVIFSGFKNLVPRLGQRSRAFRQAQGSRQRMNDLLAALVVVIIGRTLLVVSAPDSNLSLLGLIVLLMSMSLIVIGLGYLLRNTIWIRNALIAPPPALSTLLRQIN
jgi:hypothetical protein